MLMRALSVHIAHETAGAARTRHSLRPLYFERREDYLQTSGASRRGIVKVRLFVIASAAKQSMAPHKERMDCFVASAPRNDGPRYPASIHSAAPRHSVSRCSGRKKPR